LKVQGSRFKVQSPRFKLNLGPWTLNLELFVVMAVLAAGLVGCNGGGAKSAPTPNPRYAAITIVSTQTRLLGGDISVVGTVKNGDSTGHDITLHASFLDASGSEIANAEGVAEDVGAGGTGSFEIDGKIDPAKYSTTQVTVVSLGEKK